MGNIVIRHAVYCKDCFSPSILTKFRKALESTINALGTASSKNQFKAEGGVLVALSGGLGSTVLLSVLDDLYVSRTRKKPERPKAKNKDKDAISEPLKANGKGAKVGDKDSNGIDKGTQHPRRGQVWQGTPGVVYIECCGAFPNMLDRTEELRALISTRYPAFEFVPRRLEDAFDPAFWREVHGDDAHRVLHLELAKDGLPVPELKVSPARSSTRSPSPAEALRAYLSALPTQTAAQSAVQTLIRLIALHAAHARRASHLLFGTPLTSVSVSLIAGIAQGDGYAVREELYEEWLPSLPSDPSITHEASRNGGGEEQSISRPRTVRLVRPLRDVTMKECAMYAWWNSVEILGHLRLARVGQSIYGLTKDFIMGLEKDYPSTVSAIFRTLAKVEPKDQSVDWCVMCQRPMPHGIQQWKSQISIRTREMLAAAKTNVPLDADVSDNVSPASDPSSITPYLCYACHTTLTSRGGAAFRKNNAPAPSAGSVRLPVWVHSSLTQSRDPTGLKKASETNSMEDAYENEVWRVRRVERAEMREGIKAFLLEHEDEDDD
ncbi:hypothetical protein CONPUDRAFT_163521 [Coniophora puteana RWD-64-598 SS2]|uniref:Cytoplasmic tRNA 2-thiolation protein 2 n=1 Tax=Coniophora puteana (strain RWD-64-598) TaxID=741705 RepID=A0A5M3MZC7_CONPW|nr:uncharacterized protein CONPUDRAFT_163521 [Coniophora puteana RWD-64-598 SS2]EIW84376.1 hypothetical protein CONPUDRAFT_163521 [Coniophora puteana RWD-64-598 SS2]